MTPLVEELREILDQGQRSKDKKLAGFCSRLLEIYPALWLFVTEEGVEPTNNQGERVLRHAVLWRRKSFGCRSAEGCRFVERILTAVQTRRLQKLPVLEFLKETIKAYRSHQPGPRLIPE